MKKLRWGLGVMLAAFVGALAWTSVSGVQALSSDAKADDVVHSSVRKVGKDVNVKGTIYGDVFCAGQNVHVDATVYGDVLCAGAEVTIAGRVEGDVRAAGRNVTITAKVSNNASVAASEFVLDAQAKIGQDLTATATQLDVRGSVGRDVAVKGSQVSLDGHIARNAEVDSPDVKLMNSAHVGGGLYYTSAHEASIGQNAMVQGETKRTVPENGNNFSAVFYVLALIAMTVVSVVIALLFPRFVQKTSDRAIASAPKAVLVGLLGGLAMIVLTVGLAFTVVGIPLALLIVLFSFIGILLSGPIVAYWLGRVLLRNKQDANPGLVMLLGAPVLVTLAWLPWIGWPVKLVSYWLGFGALLLALRPFVGKKTLATAKSKTSKK